MRRLYLIRHAKSSWANPHLSDRDRPLNKRGKRDAPMMGERLRESGIVPDLVYTSPAKRARKTAKHIAGAVGYPLDRIERHDDIYTADVNTLHRVVKGTPESATTLFLVGHNYVLTDLAEYLTGTSLVNVPTCGVVCMEFSCQEWQDASPENCKLVFFDYPKNIQPADS
jgi:phosphohistidine phosphatase